ncbi:MAG: succinyldiaminopimelate transaminase [Gammaproteobacteria bacterium]|nr:succinyldiaminopimelate transaminase [Gammaproteobacteria bacterium]
MNPNLNQLHPYPFEKLATLKAGVTPPESLKHIALSIGEPKHDAPRFVVNALVAAVDTLNTYPLTKGTAELRQSINDWLVKRFKLDANSLHIENNILPVAGTREALFAFAQAVIDPTAVQQPLVLMPNPFYQIYEGAALLAGARPYYYETTAENDYQPDFDAIADDVWQRCQLLYICSPGNPTGAVISKQTLQSLITKSKTFDFIIASDECYSELYFDESTPPTGLLQASEDMGNHGHTNCVVFHSLSKRSNLPGLRSGFVAGDANIMSAFLKYRTYHGCALPPTHQIASIAAWGDEEHVRQNRALYTEKFKAVIDILQPVITIQRPAASFYIWLKTPICEQEFARQLFATQNITVLPGSYLSRDNNGINPGAKHVRMALVAPLDECIEAAKRIKQFIASLKAA